MDCVYKVRIMKTKKEIKPFKMRCESISEARAVKSILDVNGVTIIACNMQDKIINAYIEDNVLVYITFRNHFDEPEPELTYSEFMKLYGDEEEVFTRDDMKDFAWYYGHKPKNLSVETHLTNFLSERTND